MEEHINLLDEDECFIDNYKKSIISDSDSEESDEENEIKMDKVSKIKDQVDKFINDIDEVKKYLDK